MSGASSGHIKKLKQSILLRCLCIEMKGVFFEIYDINKNKNI